MAARYCAVAILLLLSFFPIACPCESAAQTTESDSSGFSLETLSQHIADVQSGKKNVEWLSEELVKSAKGKKLPAAQPINAALKVEKFAEVFSERLYKAVLQSLLTAPADFSTGLLSLGEVFKSGKPDFYSTLSDLFDAAKSAETLAGKGDLAALESLRDKSADDDQKRVVVSRLVPVLRAKAGQAGTKRPHKALAKLAGIPKDWRSEEDYQLAAELLTAASPAPEAALKSNAKLYSEAVDMLADDIEKKLGDTVTDRLARLRSYWVVELIRRDEVLKADYVYEKVIRSRRDPSDLNDDLRFQILLAAKSERARGFAKGRKVELHNNGAIDLQRKLSLLLHGYYGKVYFYVIGACVLVFLVLGLVLSFGRRLLLGAVKLFGVKQKEVPGYLRPRSGMDQYSQLLAKLGLDDSATDDEIKAAYRGKLKELHPDRVASEEEREAKTQELIEVKKCYQRILEIKKSRFGS